MPSKTAPFPHQALGIRALVEHPNFALFDEMGVGKSKQVLDAAGELWGCGVIDTLLIVCPASCLPTWLDPDLGEVQKHLAVDHVLEKYHLKNYAPWSLRQTDRLAVLVMSYEFLRKDFTSMRKLAPHVAHLTCQLEGRQTMVVFDESSFLKSHKAAQSKACFQLRQHCARAVILNGTPVGNNELDLYSQFACLDKKILGYENFFHFRARHAQMGGFQGKQVLRILDPQVITQKTAPFVLRRLQTDVRDVIPKNHDVREVEMPAAAWGHYEDLRDESITFLGDDVTVTPQAIVKMLRLAQLTSGYLGGLEEAGCVQIHDAKQAVLEELLTLEQGKKVIVWCRFTREIEDVNARLGRAFPSIRRFTLYGDTSRADRERAVACFHTDSPDKDPAFLIAQPMAGRFSLNLTGSHRAIYLSNDFSLLTRLQSEDRIHRAGQQHQCHYTDTIAVGPRGQRTIDRYIVKALRNKEDVATWTSQQWRTALEGR